MKGLTFLFIISVFSGCLPMVYSPYYQPSYDDSSVVSLNGVCGGKGTLGPSSGIEFALPSGIIVDFRTRNDEGSENDRFNVIIQIPSGVNAHFLSDEITVKFPDGTTNKQKTLMSVNGTKRVEPHVSLSFPIDQYCPVSGENANNHLSAELWAWNQNLDAVGTYKQLELILPKITVNGDAYSFNPITIYPYQIGTNAYSDSSYQGCLRLSPKGRCIMSYIAQTEKFEEKAGVFNLSGRAYWLQDKDNNHIEVNLDFRTQKNATLKLDTETLVLRDGTTKSTITTKLDFVDINCHAESLPLITPLSGLNSNLVVYLDGNIGSKQYSQMDVYLPSIVINGRIYNFKPIHLKRVRVDGGIVPFNC